MQDNAGIVRTNYASFIWEIADLLRGNYKPYDYGKVILPFVALRRMDCVLAPSKAKVLAAYEKFGDRPPILENVAGVQYYNTSKLNLTRVANDQYNLADSLRSYISGFSEIAGEILEKFKLDEQINKLSDENLLYLIIGKFNNLDLSPQAVSNVQMGQIYEELIRRFSELSNETAGEHFTPREVIRLMVELLLTYDDELLSKPGIVKTLYDPACGTGGMLSVAEERLRELNPQATLKTFGQELNPETYALCRADMVIKSQDANNIAQGNSFTEDAFEGERFDYLLANPPFGVDWKKIATAVKAEARLGHNGRFGAGLPRVDDGAFLFAQQMISKMKPATDGGSRGAIVFSGSPLFNGSAGTGPSEIRRWILENDWLEAIVALPDQLFYNTEIYTYFWILSTKKPAHRTHKVQLIDARHLFTKLPKNLGKKRKKIADSQIAEIASLYANFEPGPRVQIFDSISFAHQRITVERPLQLSWRYTDPLQLQSIDPPLQPAELERLASALSQDMPATVYRRGEVVKIISDIYKELRFPVAQVDSVVDAIATRDPSGEPVTTARGAKVPDVDLREQENAPVPFQPVVYEADLSARLASRDYRAAVEDYLTNEVRAYYPDAWVDHKKTKIGYSIPLTQYFYSASPNKEIAEIDSELFELEHRVAGLLNEIGKQ